MKTRCYLLACLAGTMISVSAFCQQMGNDATIEQAKTALNNKKCDDAITALNAVTEAGKSTANYLLCMARAQDCRLNPDEALKYYKKYLDINANDDSVKRRVSALETDKVNKERLAIQENGIKDLYKKSKKGKYEKYCLKNLDFAWGLVTDFYTGGEEAPYKLAIGFFNSYHKPFANRKLLFEFFGNLSYLTNGQKSWFGQIYNTDPSHVVSVPGTFGVAMELSLAYLFFDTHDYALSLGPAVGFNCFFMPGANIDNEGNELTNYFMFGPTTSIKADLYIKKHFYTSLEYHIYSKSNYSNVVNNQEIITPVNCNTLSFSVGVRGFGLPKHYYYHH